MNQLIRISTFFLCLLAATSAALAQELSFDSSLFSDEPEFLPVDQAFQFDFQQNDDELTLSWQIAEGYYLYKKQFKTVVKQAEIGEPVFPGSKQIEDEYFGISDVFYERVDVKWPIVQSVSDGVVKIRYQGCAEAGLCYPPTTKVVYLNEVVASSDVSDSQTSAADAANGSEPAASNSGKAVVSKQIELSEMLFEGDNLALTLLLFLVLGAGLAFTPCVFPMYPIISSIVVGQGNQINTRRTFTLSLVYVQGMALMYSILGLIVASAGVQFQVALQHPIILGVLIFIFVALAAAMFGMYEIQLPSSWQVKLNDLSNKQQGGSYAGVFVMGAISGLVASPCTTAPLTGILLYIAQSGDVLLGFSALYALSLGMGIPLIAFAVTGGKLLPKAGGWMNVVKITFGFMMLVVALVFVERLIENMWTNLAWAAVGLAAFGYFSVVNQQGTATFWKGVRTVTIFLGLFISAMYGYNTLYPAQQQVVSGQVADQAHVQFKIVKNLPDFHDKLAAANAEGKTVMLDLYADWCVACKEFEKYTFPKPIVQKALRDTVLLQIDLTDNTPESLEFQEAFGVLGLPTIMFFDKSGNELMEARVMGFMNAESFAAHINQLYGS